MYQTALIILLSALVVLLAARLYLERRRAQRVVSTSPPGSHPADAKNHTADSGERNVEETNSPPPVRLLKLIRYRNQSTLAARIIGEVQKELNLQRCVYYLSTESGGSPEISYQHGLSDGGAPLPVASLFQELRQLLPTDHPTETGHLVERGLDAAAFQKELRAAGLSHLIPFNLSGRQYGLLAFNGTAPAEAVIAHLSRFGETAVELMANARSFERIQELSYTDSLTGMANKRFFKRRLAEEIGRAKRYGRQVALIMFDLDDLKSVNDRYGHQAGDDVLSQLGGILCRSTRAIDIVARYGGDEFCVVMPESDREMCAQFMTRLQRKIAASKFTISRFQRDLTCTISLGGAVHPEHGSTPDELVYAADMALLKAKEAGRNKYFLYDDSPRLA